MNRPSNFRWVFAWYDFWVGVFVDKNKKLVYVFPIPCVGFVFQYAELDVQPIQLGVFEADPEMRAMYRELRENGWPREAANHMTAGAAIFTGLASVRVRRITMDMFNRLERRPSHPRYKEKANE